MQPPCQQAGSWSFLLLSLAGSVACLFGIIARFCPAHRNSQLLLWNCCFLLALSVALLFGKRGMFHIQTIIHRLIRPRRHSSLVGCLQHSPGLPPNTRLYRARICEASVPKVERPPEPRTSLPLRVCPRPKNKTRSGNQGGTIFVFNWEIRLPICLERLCLPGAHNFQRESV